MDLNPDFLRPVSERVDDPWYVGAGPLRIRSRGLGRGALTITKASSHAYIACDEGDLSRQHAWYCNAVSELLTYPANTCRPSRAAVALEVVSRARRAVRLFGTVDHAYRRLAARLALRRSRQIWDSPPPRPADLVLMALRRPEHKTIRAPSAPHT